MALAEAVGSDPASNREWAPGSLAGLIRHLATAGIAGVVTGVLVGGLGGRLFMRASGAVAPRFVQGVNTEAGNRVGEITFGGTLALVVFVGITVGIVGAVLYVVLRPWLRWAGPWRGVVFGLMLFAAGSATSDILNPDNQDFLVLGNEPINVAMIVALFLGYGVVMEWAYAQLANRLPPNDERADRAPFFYFLITLLGLVIGVPLTAMLLFTRAGCDCAPPVLASAFVAVAAAGTVAWWAGGLKPELRRVARAAPVMGYAGVAGAAVFGLMRAVSDILDVIG